MRIELRTYTVGALKEAALDSARALLPEHPDLTSQLLVCNQTAVASYLRLRVEPPLQRVFILRTLGNDGIGIPNSQRLADFLTILNNPSQPNNLKQRRQDAKITTEQFLEHVPFTYGSIKISKDPTSSYETPFPSMYIFRVMNNLLQQTASFANCREADYLMGNIVRLSVLGTFGQKATDLTNFASLAARAVMLEDQLKLNPDRTARALLSLPRIYGLGLWPRGYSKSGFFGLYSFWDFVLFDPNLAANKPLSERQN